MSHLLDRPAWSALASRHAHLAEGGPLARRYPPSIIPFAATGADDQASLAALAALVQPGERAMIVQNDAIVLPAGLTEIARGRVVQMLGEAPSGEVHDGRIVRLADADAAEMLALATLTRPGPFTLRARDLGEFWGVRIDGWLAAMAGERMRQDGFAELSGVCTHPDFRGRGLGRLLSIFVTARIAARGETPYLHAYESNEAAIGLYKTLGFRWRATLNLVVAGRD